MKVNICSHGGYSCTECGLYLWSENGVLVHQQVGNDCPNTGKKYKYPTIELEEVK